MKVIVRRHHMGEITFLHTADLHLDSPMVGLRHLPERLFVELRESTFRSFAKVIDTAIAHHVDFVIIAGDLYDGEDRSIRAQVYFRKQMERLQRHGIHAFVIHGNHDHLNGAWTMVKMPNNVHIFGEKVEMLPFVTKNNTRVHLYGFSYPKRHIYNDITVNYVKQAGADYHIGILHGHSEGVSEHSRYAPFRIQQLVEKQFDYWALGHIHQREILYQDPAIIYPGNIQGRNRLETGEKGCYIVKMNEAGATLHWQETAAIIWEKIVLDGEKVQNFDELYELCRRSLDKLRTRKQKMIVSMEIRHLSSVETFSESKIDELLDLLQEEEQEEDVFIYPATITYTENLSISRETLAEEADFYRVLFQLVDEYEAWDEATSMLYKHHHARKHLPQLTDQEKEQLLKEAENTLLKLLHND